MAFLAGLRGRSGIEVRVGPVAIANGRFGNRPHCIYRGFCLQGCKVNAKASPLITHVPDALAHGAEIRADCMVTPDRARRRRPGHRRDLLPRRGRAPPAGPGGGGRRLLDRDAPAACSTRPADRFPDGLCNDYDQVGRYVMVQGAPQTAGRYEDEVRAYKAPPPEVSTEAFYETDPTKDYQRGFSLQCVSPLPIVFAEHVAAQGHWGERAARVHARLRPLGHLRGPLRVPPSADNRVTLADETDRHGLPVADFSYTMCDNDRALAKAATEVMEDMHRAAGAEELITINRYAHLVGGCRMAADERPASSTATSAPSPCPTSTSPTAASARPRAAPTRR